MGQRSVEANRHQIQPTAAEKEKVIIDTDPGIGT
jgi:predicted RNase H-like nuclease (RuvC/YqgF family)